MGIADNFGEAFYKAQEATQTCLPLEGTAVISVNSKDKPEVVDVVKDLVAAGFKIMATGRTYDIIVEAGFEAKKIDKMYEGRPNIGDVITNRQVQLVINTPSGKESKYDDSYIRKAAIKTKTCYITTMAAAKATASGINTIKERGNSEVKSLQELHAQISEK